MNDLAAAAFNAEDLPEKCRDCPVQQDIIDDIAHVAILKSIVSHTAANHFLGQPGEDLERVIIEEFGDEKLAASELAEMRSSLAEGLDSADERDEMLRDRSELLSETCDGVFKLRATDSRSDKIYTVGICTSVVENSDNKRAATIKPVNVQVTKQVAP